MAEKFAFVVFHTSLSPKGIEAISDIYTPKQQVRWKERWLAFQKDYLPHAEDYIETLFQSAKLLHPDCKCFVLTDLKTPLKLPEHIEIHRFQIDPDKPAYSRQIAQREFVKQSDNSFHKVFLDYDMLIQKKLDEIAGKDFDIGLTYDQRLKLIGGSFIFIHKGSERQGLRFFELVEEIYAKAYTQYEAWGGIQVSMNDLIYLKVPAIKYLEVSEIEQIKIIIFPSDKYNYPLNDHEMEQLEYLPEKMILHFKGIRKKGMLEYWNTYLRPR